MSSIARSLRRWSASEAAGPRRIRGGRQSTATVSCLHRPRTRAIDTLPCASCSQVPPERQAQWRHDRSNDYAFGPANSNVHMSSSDAQAGRSRAQTHLNKTPSLVMSGMTLKTPAQPRPHHRHASSISQRPGSDSVNFPGAVNSKFTHDLHFSNPTESEAMPTYRVLDSSGAIVDASKAPPDISDADLLTMYTNMVTLSIMDIVMFEAQRQGRLSFYMVSAGEEGIAVGSAAALSPQDVIFAQYREAGVLQQRGFTLDDFMAQLFAHRGDPGKGRNMPVHYGSRALNVHTISSPLATQIPQAAGAAYALKLRHAQNRGASEADRAICACYFGEGAASEGDFHAGLNFAATRSCPVVFICRNNGYAISTTTLEQYRGDGIASRGTGYGIETVRVDGNDVLAVRAVMAEARRRALGLDEDGGMRPVLIEAMSYRVSHHSTSDDSFAYRAKVEVEDWKRRDSPIVRLRKYLEGRGLWDDERERTARHDIRKDVMDAFKRAEKEKKAPLRALFEDVYEEITEEQEEQIRELKDILDRYPDEYDVSEFEGGKEGLMKPTK